MASQYASAGDLSATGLPAEAVAGIDVDRFLLNASALVDSYLRGRYSLPLTSPPPVELANAVIAIAAWDILRFRGLNPDEFDSVYRERHDFYLGAEGRKGWLDKLAAGAVSLNIASDSTPVVNEGGELVLDGARRGWDDSVSSIGEPIGNFWNCPKDC